jgi:hypothetical protein
MEVLGRVPEITGGDVCTGSLVALESGNVRMGLLPSGGTPCSGASQIF